MAKSTYLFSGCKKCTTPRSKRIDAMKIDITNTLQFSFHSSFPYTFLDPLSASFSARSSLGTTFSSGSHPASDVYTACPLSGTAIHINDRYASYLMEKKLHAVAKTDPNVMHIHT